MISAVILAAGSSTRLGRPKQLVALGGVPALQHVVDAAAERVVVPDTPAELVEADRRSE